MTRYLCKMFSLSLGLTLVIELPVGMAMGMKRGKNLALMVLVNVMTNPAAVLACWLGCPQVPVEIVVVVSEMLIYLWFSRDEKWNIPRPLLLACVCNIISWSLGLLVQKIGVLL